jgi:hypothetical protein
MIGRVLVWREPARPEPNGSLSSEPLSLQTLPTLLAISAEDIPLEGIEEDWDFAGTLDASGDENEDREER